MCCSASSGGVRAANPETPGGWYPNQDACLARGSRLWGALARVGRAARGREGCHSMKAADFDRDKQTLRIRGAREMVEGTKRQVAQKPE